MADAARAVIFDLDDTLFDHGGSVRNALAGWLPPVPALDLAQLTKVWFDLEHVHYESWRAGRITFDEQRHRRVRDFWPHLGRRVAPHDDLDALFAGYLTHYEHAWRAFDDARSALVDLTRLGYLTAVLTNGTTAQQNAKVDRIGLRSHLGAPLTSEELGVAKPDPRAYLSACEHLGVEPSQALHVGDRYDLDVLSARAAGLQAIHLDRRPGHDDNTEDHLASLRDLPAHLKETSQSGAVQQSRERGTGASGRSRMVWRPS